VPWTNAQLQQFGVMLLAMGEAYEAPVSEARVEILCRALEDLPFAAVTEAANTHIRTSKFFPKASELRELVEGNTDDQAELAWQWLQREIRRVGYVGRPTWPDEVTQRAAEGLFGGWVALCERLPGEGPELLGFRKQFVALYGATARKAQQGELGPGREEAKGLLDGLKQKLQAMGLPTGKK